MGSDLKDIETETVTANTAGSDSALAKKILIFHIRISRGHERAAEAIGEAFNRNYPDSSVKLVEAVGFSSPLFSVLLSNLYLGIVHIVPRLWDAMYDSPQVDKFVNKLLDIWTWVFGSRFLKLLGEESPDVIICTQAIPSQIFSRLKTRGAIRSDIPIYAVATDYGVHRFWRTEEIDGYFVPSDSEITKLKGMGVEEENIFKFGIPIHPSLLDAPAEDNIDTARKKYGLNNGQPTLLLMGGSRGVCMSKSLVKMIENLRHQVNVIAVAGTNQDLYKTFLVWADNSKHHVNVFGFTDSIQTLYELSDLAVTKPGGLTVAECNGVGLPYVILGALPGQEQQNLEFVCREGLAQNLLSPEAVTAQIQFMLDHQTVLEQIKTIQKKIALPNAAYAIADKVMDRQRLRQLSQTSQPVNVSVTGA